MVQTSLETSIIDYQNAILWYVRFAQHQTLPRSLLISNLAFLVGRFIVLYSLDQAQSSIVGGTTCLYGYSTYLLNSI